jgi:hypothetical protein
MLLNTDTRVLDDALARLVAYLDAHPDCGAAAAQLVNPDSSVQRACTRFPTRRTALFLDTPLGRAPPAAVPDEAHPGRGARGRGQRRPAAGDARVKVLHLAPGFPPELRGGVERYVEAVCPALERRGVRCAVAAGSEVLVRAGRRGARPASDLRRRARGGEWKAAVAAVLTHRLVGLRPERPSPSMDPRPSLRTAGFDPRRSRQS